MPEINTVNLLEKYIPDSSGFAINENIVDVDSSAQKYFSSHYKKYYSLAIISTAVYIALVSYAIFSTGLVAEEPRVLALLLIPVFIYYGILAGVKNKMLHEFYKQFALANNFYYKTKGLPENETGAVFLVGHSREIWDVVTGTINNLPISLFNFNYTVGSGKSSRSYAITAWSIDFKNPVPPMLLLCDRHYFGDNLSDNNLNNVSQISLPAEVEKNFTLYAEKKFEIEALQIFSPDFLENIRQNFKQFSLDFVGTKLYVYSGKIIKNKADLELLRRFILLITERLNQQLPAMSGSINALHTALGKAETSSPLGKAGQQISLAFQDPKVSSALVWGLLIIFLILFALSIIISLTR